MSGTFEDAPAGNAKLFSEQAAEIARLKAEIENWKRVAQWNYDHGSQQRVAALEKANADNDRGMAVTLTAVWAAINGKSNDLAEINEPMARRIDSILAACTLLQETAEKRGDLIAELEAANAEIIKACRGAYVAALRPVDDGSLDCIRESLGAVIRAPQATGTVNNATLPVGDSEGRETGDGQADAVEGDSGARG